MLEFDLPGFVVLMRELIEIEQRCHAKVESKQGTHIFSPADKPVLESNLVEIQKGVTGTPRLWNDKIQCRRQIGKDKNGLLWDNVGI